MASDANPDFCMSSIPSMTVELVASVSCQGKKKKTEKIMYQSTLLPEPAMKRIFLSAFAKHQAMRGEPTFPVYPEKRARSRRFPFGERAAVDEPRPSLAVPRFATGVVIFPWIWGSKPTSNLTQQFVACQLGSVLPSINANMEMTNVSTCSCRPPFDEGFLALSQTRK
jgi:hypothetical protein